MLHRGSVGRVHSQECFFMFKYTFLVFFVAFHQKICLFFIFISFSDEELNFRNKLLTNQKPEEVVTNFQRNCMVSIMDMLLKNFKTLLSKK